MIRRPLTAIHLIVGSDTYRISDVGYAPSTGEVYQPRLLNSPDINRSGTCVLWKSGSRSSGLGSIESINNDGYYDSLILGDQSDARVEVYQGWTDDAVSSLTLIGSAQVDDILGQGEDTMRIITASILTKLDVPLQPELYQEGDADAPLIGRPKPVAIGSPLSCPIVQTSIVDEFYDAHDNPGFELVTVRDGGYPLTPIVDYFVGRVDTVYGPELRDVPVARVVADVKGGDYDYIVDEALGDFDDGLTGWTTYTTGSASVTDVGGGARFQGALGEDCELYVTGVEAGFYYRWSFEVYDYVSGELRVLLPDPTIIGGLSVGVNGNPFGFWLADTDGVFCLRKSVAADLIGDEAIDLKVRNIRVVKLIPVEGDIESMVRWLVARANLDPDEVLDSTTLSALSTARPWPQSIWADGSERISNIIERLMDSLYASLYETAEGKIGFFFLQPPGTVAPSATLVYSGSRDDFTSDLFVERDYAPGLASTVAGLKNWFQYRREDLRDGIDDSEIPTLTADYRARKVSPELGEEYASRAAAQEFKTYLNDEDDLQELADLGAELYPPGQQRRFYSIDVFNDGSLSTLNPGNEILVTHPRFGLSGSKRLVLINFSKKSDDVIKIVAWGSSVSSTGEAPLGAMIDEADDYMYDEADDYMEEG